jgi:hypothetical protein
MSADEAALLIDHLEKIQYGMCPSEAEWNSALLDVERYLERNPQDARTYAILGESYFLRGENQKYPQIEEYLRRALNLGLKSPFVPFFLGMYYFNCGRYEEVLTVLSDLDLSCFELIGQGYRGVEVKEVLICSRLYLDPEKVQVSELSDLAEEFLRIGQMEAKAFNGDLSLAAVTPNALVRCVKNLRQRKGMHEKAEQLSQIVSDLILKLGVQGYLADDAKLHRKSK